MDPEIEKWRKYLRRDPTRFLLDDVNPSVSLWYLIDIAHRPEDSLAVRDARERVLYSTPVQGILNGQRAEGYWEPMAFLSEPRFRATLWNLALLAELGIPRDSRRARSSAEFALQNFMDERGVFSGVSLVDTGFLIHALTYFGLARDPRVHSAAKALIERVKANPSDDSRLAMLWALTGLQDDRVITEAALQLKEQFVESVSDRHHFGEITFPQFDPGDLLFVLRVLSFYRALNDPRLAVLIDMLIQKQNDFGQWPLEKSLNGRLVEDLEEQSTSSRWATLNAVRVIVNLIGAEKGG